MTSKPILYALVVAGLGAASQPVAAATYDLRAASTTITMGDGTVVPMWGFGLNSDPVSVPGPALVIPSGDDTLIINFTNDLTVPVSIVIPGIPAPLTPVWDDGTTGPRTALQQRAVSFTHVALPGETVVYQWANIQPGTYLYHSGANPAVQVPMGLYGAVTHDDATAGQTYGVPHDRDVVLVYSDVDPALNAAVDDGTYGTTDYPVTIQYRPRYFLVNGQETSAPIDVPASVNERLLLRVINAGLRTIVPTLSSGAMRLLAEDGHAAPFARDAYSMLLAPGQTRDALLVLTEQTSTVLFDRRGASRLAKISAAPVDGAPNALGDVYAATEDAVLDTALAGLDGVLANDGVGGVGLTAVLDSPTSAGELVLNLDGSFVYTPDPDFHGVDTFRYHATDGTLSSNVVTVSIQVAAANDAPVAADDAYQAIEGEPLIVTAPGVLANDTDNDLDALTAQLVIGPAGGTLVQAGDGSFQYIANPGTTSDNFTYQASDGTVASNVATVTITVVPPVNDPPVAADDFATTLRNTPIDIVVTANDSDPDGSIASITVTSDPDRGGTAEVLNATTVRFTPRNNFKGTDEFTYVITDDQGAISAPATVRVNVVKP